MMQTDVKAVHTEATATLYTGRTRVKGYHCISGGTAGDVIFRDGGASGVVRLQFNVGAGTQPIVMSIPGEGILFESSVHVTVPTSAKVTVFYG
jgi:ribosomal protein L35AE/L33A